MEVKKIFFRLKTDGTIFLVVLSNLFNQSCALLKKLNFVSQCNYLLFYLCIYFIPYTIEFIMIFRSKNYSFSIKKKNAEIRFKKTSWIVNYYEMVQHWIKEVFSFFLFYAKQRILLLISTFFVFLFLLPA